MAVDAQKLVSKYIREHPDVVELATRVVSKPPDRMDTSWVQVVQQHEGRQADDPTHHLRFCNFQCDCYSGSEGGLPEAAALAGAVRDALVHISEASHEGAVVTGSRIDNGFLLLRDPALFDRNGDPRDRVIVTATVYLHPA